jgi:hypothetical protein
MKVIRYDQIGFVRIRLLSRPTNTCAGVDNFHIYAECLPGSPEAPVVRFLGTDAFEAHDRYDHAVMAAEMFMESNHVNA